MARFKQAICGSLTKTTLLYKCKLPTCAVGKHDSFLRGCGNFRRALSKHIRATDCVSALGAKNCCHQQQSKDKTENKRREERKKKKKKKKERKGNWPYSMTMYCIKDVQWWIHKLTVTQLSCRMLEVPVCTVQHYKWQDLMSTTVKSRIRFAQHNRTFVTTTTQTTLPKFSYHDWNYCPVLVRTKRLGHPETEKVLCEKKRRGFSKWRVSR